MCPSRFDLSDDDAVAFCPSCGAGYIAGVTRCSDCRLALMPRAEVEMQVAREIPAADDEGAMKMVYTTQRPWVAQMLTDVLQEHDIAAQIAGRKAHLNFAQPVTIWVPEKQFAEAETVISNIEASQLESEPEPEHSLDAEHIHEKSVVPTYSGEKFFMGMILGAFLGIFMGAVLAKGYYANQAGTVSEGELPGNTDRNGDGVQDIWKKYSLVNNEPIMVYDSDYDGSPDEWFHYERGVLVRAEYDRNKDEKPDSWWYYSDLQQVDRVEEDDNFDGEPDRWLQYSNGAAHEFTSDNDFDGRVDEWGSYENGLVKERSISFRNDSIADKRVYFERNRRVRVEYDRDRDEVFEEARIFDAFGEVTNVTELRSPLE